jgi:hypothetical protein
MESTPVLNATTQSLRRRLMKNALFSLILTLASALTLTAGTRVVPIAGHLPGANGSSWTTDISLTNNDATATEAQLVFHSDAGATVSRSVHLSGGSSLLLDDAVRPDSFPGANPAGWIGQLEVRSAGNVSASARTFTSATSGGTYGSAYESYDPAVLSSNGAVAGLVNSGRYRSNVAYSNSSGAIAVVSYDLRGEDGVLLAHNLLTVPAHSTLQIALARDVASSADDSRILLEWSSTTPLYVLASVVDNRSNDPTNIPSANSGTELFFPVVGRTAGAQSTFWSTSASISSRADVAGNVTFAYRDNNDGQLYTKTVAIGARGTVNADDLNGFVGAGAGTGSLTVTSTVRIVATVRLFNTTADGSTFGSALLPQDDSVRSSRVVIKGVRRDDSYRLNISLSTQSGATDGTVRLRDDNGQEVESEPFHLESGKMLQVALNRGSAQVRSGEVEVETHNGVSLTAVASSIDNSTGDTSVRESEQENERQHELEIRISPSTAAIGAPVSFSIDDEHGTANGATAVQWSFGDGTTGSGLTATHAYTRAGEFEVSAEVTLANGAIVRDQEDVHVLSAGGPASNGPIDFSWSPVAPAAGQQVTFTASRTSSGGSFKWKFPGNVRINGAVAAFTFAAAGSFEVELELEHEGSTTLHATHIVTVGGTTTGGGGSTSIDFTWTPTAPAAGQAISFTASGGNGGAFVFKFPGNIRRTGSSITFTFAAAGSYQVELEQEKEGSVTLHATHVVNVGGDTTGGGGSSIDFTWTPTAPAAGQAITFTASGGNGGAFVFKFPGNIRKTGSVVTFTFDAAGSYEVELEQEREGSVTLHAEHPVVVAGGTTTGGGGTPTSVDFSWTPTSPKAGQTVTFTATSDKEPPAGASFKWRLPDDSRPLGKSVTYTFTTAGTYKIRVELEHAGAASIERERNIVIAP